jgi:hypothetical protein
MVRAFVAVWNRVNVAVHHSIQQAPADPTHFSPAHRVLAVMKCVRLQQEQFRRALRVVSSKAETGNSPLLILPLLVCFPDLPSPPPPLSSADAELNIVLRTPDRARLLCSMR